MLTTSSSAFWKLSTAPCQRWAFICVLPNSMYSGATGVDFTALSSAEIA